MDYNQLIGTVLEEVIQQKNITLTKLARKTGLTQSYLSKIVSGKMSKLPVNTLAKLVTALGLEMSVFMAEVEKKNGQPVLT